MRLSIATCTLCATLATPILAQDSAKVAPKVLIITMFGQEAKPWLENEAFSIKTEVPGLNPEYPTVECSDAGLCLMTTAMGFSNAASSVAAVALSPKFDLSQSYVVIAGIGGVDPKDGTLGSAHWAKYVVDADLNHRIDSSEVPEDWSADTIGLGAEIPGEKPKWGAGTEVFALNPDLVDFAYDVTKDVPLVDGETAVAYRAHYDQAAAQGKPFVSICDTLSSDTYWHGSKIAESKEEWVALLTDGKANYCTTQMEDNASLTALKRASEAGLLDFDRVALLRTASNFDRQGHDQSAVESLKAKSGGFPLATENAYRVAKAYAEVILSNWGEWKAAPQVK
ncbi:purine nucleoside permease [Pseudorhodobacter turbinis]|uniref:Purine nucleoside permease n=1 Tax=Pseudorhodobacter turbinis TaxID=2500533 RepID=A0A4P8ED76_9RHOB|nr:purine nucleoside permease [Pseudorhodobacter turbinis]QCO54699.1 purine nucleoside permease [Pseudorhodobacter turbinis]